MAGGAARTLLLVDDEPAQVRLVTALAARGGWRTIAAPDGGKALALLDDGAERIAAVLIDVWRPGDSSPALVAELRRRWPEMPIVMLTAQSSTGLAMEAMRAGANDFLLKPVAPARLLAALESAAVHDGDQSELRPLAEQVDAPLGFDGIVGSAPAMRVALAAAAIAARSRAPALVVGGAGTGKTLIARAIHAASSRARKPALVIPLGGMAPMQAEWDLFGHAEGPASGAFRSDPGQAARADGGTLILSDVAALGPLAQRQLLSLIEDGRMPAAGGRPPRLVDTRVIALAERPLLHDVAEGRLRKDLVEALSAHDIRVPALADRIADLPALARHLLTRIGRQPGMRRIELSDEAAALLARHPWPGNVRQLHDALFRAVLAASGEVLTPEDFPRIAHSVPQERQAQRPAEAAAGVELYGVDGHLRALEEIEADVIRLAIGHYEGRMSEVARRLGIGRSTLYRKLVDLGLDTAA